MHNIRTVTNPHLAKALRKIERVYREHDVAGATLLVSAEETALVYPLMVSWNAIRYEDSVTGGLRIGVKPTALETEVRGTIQTLRQLTTFGAHTQLWVSDIVALLKRAGLVLPSLHEAGP